MSASAMFASAASGRPFLFDEELAFPPARTRKPPLASYETAFDGAASEIPARQRWETVGSVVLSKLPAAITPASRLEVRPAPEMVSSGIRELDALTGGLPRGCLTEICGPASCGRTSILLAALAHTTQRGEVCALVDANDAFDPTSA